jgi:tetratricopeptide (TPR) repeat protein
MHKNLILIITVLNLLLAGCKNSIETEQEAQRADSLSIKLNSPELKAVNAELLNDPGNAALYDKRAKIYLGLKQMEEAVNDSKRAIKLDSAKAEYYMTLVDSYFGQNKTRQAKEQLESTVKKFPQNIDALLKLSELYFLVRHYQEGITYVNKALELDPNKAKAYYIKGSIYKESGDTAKAISSLETAVEQDNKFEDAYLDLGIMYAARKSPLALDYYNNVLRINPSNASARYARAKFLQDIGKAEESIKEYEAILSQNKECENCYYNLGAIYLEIKNDPKKALEMFTKAIEIDPNYVEAYFARGYTYSKLKDKESAKADYNMCLKIQPGYEGAIQGLNEL